MNEAVSRDLFARDVEVLRNLTALRKWTILQAEYPTIDVIFTEEGKAPLRVRVVAANWNSDPAVFELLEPDGRAIPRVP